jgi:iron complex outermembrane recepter protein
MKDCALAMRSGRRLVDARASESRAAHAQPSGARRARRSLTALAGALGVLLSPAVRAQAPAEPAQPPAAEPEPAPAEPAAEAEPEPAAAEPAASSGDPGADAAAEPSAADEAALLEEVGDVDVGGEPGRVDEVVITVDRRQKNLQKYSGTASAFTERQLSSLGITSVRQLSSMVPGLQIGTQEGNTEVFIRGVGSDNNAEHGDPATAVHIDNVYIPRPRGLGSMFFDIERVEVNSGPQGTLRGRNALAGTINIISAKPKLGEFDANAEATFGSYSQRRYQGMVNIPVGDALAFRFAAFSEVRDPYWINAGQIYDIRPAEDADSYALRAQAKWQPTPALTVLVGYDYTAERGTGWLGTNYNEYLTAENQNGTPNDQTDDVAIPLQVEDVDNPRRVNYFGAQPRMEMAHQGVRAEITYDAGPVIFDALGSFRDLHYEHNTGSSDGLVWDDPDGAGPLPGYDWSTQNFNPDSWGQSFSITESRSWVAELRAYAPDSARFRWTVGGFFFKEDQKAFLGQTSDPANYYGGQEFTMPDVPSGSVAGYADATFDVVESFRVLGGIRVTSEYKDRKNGFWGQWGGIPGTGDPPPAIQGLGRFGTEGFKYAGFNRSQLTLPSGSSIEDRVNVFLNGIESFGARDQVAQVLCADPPTAAEGQPQQQRVQPTANGGMECTNGVNPTLGGPTTPFDISVTPQNNHDDNVFFDWRAGFEYDLAKDNLLYFTVTTGHKAGGYNDTLNVGMGQPLYNSTYDPESILAFELGSKNVFNDRRIRLNASAFWYKYTDMVFQILREVVEDPNPNDNVDVSSSTAVRDNAASANIYGIDIDFVYSLPAGLEAEVHALLMDARFGDGVQVQDGRIGFDVPDYEVDIGGNWLPRASPYTLNYTLSQLIPTTAGSFSWIISGQTRGQHYMTPYNGEGKLLPAVNENPLPVNENGMVTSQQYNDLTRENGSIRLTDVVPAYSRFDVGVGWRHPEGRLSIDAFVNNIFDVAYATTIISTPGLNLRFFNPPRVAGVRVRVDW